MTQCCGKIPSDEDVNFIVQTVLNTVDRYGDKWQGNLGEEVAIEYSTQVLDLREERFDKRNNGFDCVFRDGSGKLVIVESKATIASGVSALGYTQHGREGSVEWVEYKAQLMCNPTSSFYTEANAKIGQEILEIGAENVSFLVIHTPPDAQAVQDIDVTRLR